ncbi:unnamed protein product [Protopolystoma xenopodis]|uniref:Uncharacterized protein n=1 Tax=Protopolystoma xenopodis TaxID=117903 RepID=A0A448X4J3_9PLAT|nr:unnamed protein product [Protopolystoma xenopodis]
MSRAIHQLSLLRPTVAPTHTFPTSTFGFEMKSGHRTVLRSNAFCEDEAGDGGDDDDDDNDNDNDDDDGHGSGVMMMMMMMMMVMVVVL